MTTSSACEQIHGETQPLHPIVDYEPDSAGSQYRDPRMTAASVSSTYASENTILVYVSLCHHRLHLYLYVLRKSIEDLLGDIDCFGEIPLSLLINNIFSRIIPVEITNGFLRKKVK